MKRIANHIVKHLGWYLVVLYFGIAFHKWGYWEQMWENVKLLATFTFVDWLMFIGALIAIVLMFAFMMFIVFILFGGFSQEEEKEETK